MLVSACSSAEEGGADAGMARAQPPARDALVPAPPSPDPFPGQDEVRLESLFAALAAEVPVLARAPQVRRDFESLLPELARRDDQALYLDYVRVRLAFEATRAGGLWGLAWRITDQQPQSDRIWAQWRGLAASRGADLPAITAIAECDELSALFAFVAHAIGLSKRSQVGLLWPAANHTVAVWVIEPGARETRVVVPTSQVFLDGAQSLGTARFDPWAQKRIFDYRRVDAEPGTRLPAPLARAFVRAVREHVPQSQAALQGARNRREQAQAGGGR